MSTTACEWPALFERHPHPMWIVEPSTLRIIGANSAAAELFGFSRDELLALTLAELRAQQGVPSLLESWLRSPERGLGDAPVCLGTAALRSARGPAVQVEVSVNAVESGDGHAVLCLFQDVTERTRTAEALQRSHERFLALTQAVNGVIWDLNLVTGEVWRGDGAHEIYGTAPTDLEPRVDDWVGRLHPDDAARVRAGFDKAIQDGGRTWHAEYRLRQPDGSYLDVEDYAVILRDTEGRAMRMIGTAVDVSERRRAQEAQQLSERRLRTLFESSMVGIVFGDIDGNIIEANQAFLDMIGYTREELAARRLNARDITPPEQIPITDRALRQAPGGWVVPYEKEYIRKDGTRIPVMVSVSTFPGSDREGFALVLDLTEMRRAQGALVEHQRRLQALFDTTQDAILLFNQHGYYIDVNPAACELLGYTRDELLKLHMFDMFPDDEMPHVHAIRQQVLDTGRSMGEVRRRRKDGSIVEVEYRAVANITPGVHLTVLRDITPRKRAEQALADRQDRHQALFDNTLDAILLFDDQGRYLDANPAACALYGYTRAEMLQRTVFDMVPPEEVPALRERVRELLSEGRARGVQRRQRRDGTALELEGHAVANIVPGVHLAVLRDLRERRESERALRSLSGRLLQMQDEERRRLAREIHDSTAQSLAALALGLAVVAEGADALETRERRALDDAQALVQQCARELRTISYLLHPPLLDEMGLASALRGYVDGFARRSGIEVVLEVPEADTRLPREVETALFRIVQECLTNIHRHSGSPTARVRLLLDAESLVLEVADQGRGLPGAEPGAHPLHELGVGVAGMQERVRQLGGRLDIVSGNTGTTVRAVLPRVDP